MWHGTGSSGFFGLSRLFGSMNERDQTDPLYGTRVSAALNVCFRRKNGRGVDVRSIKDTAVIELLLTLPEREVER